ncbi:MAG: hypothetical protein KDM91_22880, partial [Verrucomicrobiae bacterium]|nr:hypothetical protein [Verrucomicrobiae bacterium]
MIRIPGPLFPNPHGPLTARRGGFHCGDLTQVVQAEKLVSVFVVERPPEGIADARQAALDLDEGPVGVRHRPQLELHSVGQPVVVEVARRVAGVVGVEAVMDFPVVRDAVLVGVLGGVVRIVNDGIGPVAELVDVGNAVVVQVAAGVGGVGEIEAMRQFPEIGHAVVVEIEQGIRRGERVVALREFEAVRIAVAVGVG